MAHQGRYQKRVAERVQNYSATDLNAILGGVGGFSAAPTPMYSSGGHNAEKAKADKSGGCAEQRRERKREKREGKRKKILSPTLPPETTISLQIRLTRSLHPLKIGGDGQSDSSHLDTMGVGRRKRSLKWTSPGFNEADQEQLALAAHDGANRGKRGLGVGTTTVKSF